ncbi:U3 snoRNP protein [Coemansia sp. S2]|nr:U3 snoRNP protein [Coemansia sp. S2]
MIFELLEEMMTISQVVDLDYTVEPVVGILMQNTVKTREARVQHGADCFEMLAMIRSFDNVRMLLTPLHDILCETDTPKHPKAVEGVHGIINQYLTLSTKTAKDTQKSHEEAELQKRMCITSDDKVTVHMRYTDVGPKRDYFRFDTDNAKVLGLLDPFVDLTGNRLYSRYNSVITQCRKIWAVLVSLPLPSVLEGTPVVIKRLFALFHQASNCWRRYCARRMKSMKRRCTCDSVWV